MPNDREQDIDLHFNSFEFFQKLERSLANKLGLPELKAGLQVIRDNNGWRENEKLIEYVWIVSIARSFIGWGGLFAIKFKENKFRDYSNPEELVSGLFISDQDGVNKVYSEQLSETTDIIQSFKFNLFEANTGITLDGITYNVRIIALNIDTFLQINNPNTEDWKNWENELWTLGKNLAFKSQDQQMIELFDEQL